MATKYPNLAAEMARNGIKVEDVYRVTADAVGKSPETVSKWINGKAGELSVKAAFAIKNQFFPKMTVDYLFETSATQ